MNGDQPSDAGVPRFERSVSRAALAAAPIMVVLGTVAMLVSPHIFAESESVTGTDLWVGASVGLGLFIVVGALPQLLFGLALRAGGRGKLEATAVAAPVWAVFVGGLPLIGAVIGGFEGLSPLASVTAVALAAPDRVTVTPASAPSPASFVPLPFQSM